MQRSKTGISNLDLVTYLVPVITWATLFSPHVVKYGIIKGRLYYRFIEYRAGIVPKINNSSVYNKTSRKTGSVNNMLPGDVSVCNTLGRDFRNCPDY